jgi:2-polyprenyl-3-methyl-5-hydroxy-6-metoxy-1,4-benzoquinol methylase
VASAANEIIGLYRRHARAWASARGTLLAEKGWIDRFAQMLPPSAQILDIGCGSGEPIARDLVARGCSVTGVDSAPEMIEMFRANCPGQDAVVADMRHLQLGRRFDGVLAWDSLFHLPHDDQRAMVPRFAEHARPGAPLMFTSGPAHGEAIGTLEGEPLYHASLAPEEYVRLLGASDFELVAHVAEDPTCGDRTVWLARRR